MIEVEARWLLYALMASPIALVHVWYPYFADRFIRTEHVWLGLVGGVALGYVVLYMLPKVSAMSVASLTSNPDAHQMFHLRAYIVLLFGVALYVVIDRLEQSSAQRQLTTARYLQFSTHAAYNFFAGYLAVELPRPGVLPHALAVTILIMHLMGMSHLLRHQQPQAYPRGRWLLAVLVLVGAFLGLVTELPRPFVNTSTAFLAGIILINVVAEELPLGHKNKLWWFLLGVCLFLLATFIITSTPLREGYSPY